MTIYYYQLYALPSDDIDRIRDRVSELLNVEFNAHDSDGWGEYYMTEFGDEIYTVSIYPNLSWEDKIPHEEDYAEFPLLLSIYNSENQPREKKLLENDPEILAVKIESLQLAEEPD